MGIGDVPGGRLEVRNSLSGAVVLGSTVQAGEVHGDVHLHLNATAAAQSTADVAALLHSALTSSADGVRRRMLEQLLTDLEAVHGDYLVMFESILERTPSSWEQGSPGFDDQVRAVAGQLRQLRLAYEPVRVRVHATAEALRGAAVAAPERVFVEAVLGYFPTGELQDDEATGRWRTSGTAVLDQLYRALDGELGQELGTLVQGTLDFHRRGWSEVCRAYAVLQLDGGAAR
ncbi:hypothetical protein F4556_005392 [Kitasatospora gansuensis]|uniref:Uncharacterized protein n=1 Tax=Kitasatospora gansuensis TaxID=258050 RepID=A0A7W7WJH5_9ACTN|nr:hypothetical protein [Kitasatospora gansuensis]MBB4949857.1 hypothetical protein [Kitasatospora gansuensis]